MRTVWNLAGRSVTDIPSRLIVDCMICMIYTDEQLNIKNIITIEIIKTTWNDTFTNPFMYFTLDDCRISYLTECIRSLVWKKSFLLKRYSLFCCLIDIKYKWKAASLFLLPVLNVKGTVLFISFVAFSTYVYQKELLRKKSWCHWHSNLGSGSKLVFSMLWVYVWGKP